MIAAEYYRMTPFSVYTNCVKIVSGWGFAPDATGRALAAYNALVVYWGSTPDSAGGSDVSRGLTHPSLDALVLWIKI